MNSKDITVPSISVIMSVYNSEEYLKEAVDSILNQTFTNFEFIITDDCSTDSSLKILEEYEKNDERIILVKNTENLGLTINLNRMINVAKGDYIARMDADDISLPSRFEKQFKFMEENHDIGVCGTNIQFFGNYNELSELPANHNEIKVELLFKDVIMHPTVMIRMSILNKYKFRYDESFIISQDYDLWCRMIDYTKFANLSGPLLKYRFMDSNITNSTKTEYRESFLRKIFTMQLNKIGITPTENEIISHIRFTYGETLKKFKDMESIKELILKLILKNQKTQFYDQNILENVISKHWFSICTNSTKFGLISLNLFRSIKFKYPYNHDLKYKIKFFLKCLIKFKKKN